MKMDPSGQLHTILLIHAKDYPSLLLVLSVVVHKRHFYISSPFVHCSPFSSSLVWFGFYAAVTRFCSAKAICVHHCFIMWQLCKTESFLNTTGVGNRMQVDGNAY